MHTKTTILSRSQAIFNSPVCEVAERQRESAPCRRLGTTFSDLVEVRRPRRRGRSAARDTGRAQGEAGGGTRGGANDKALAVVLDLGLGQRIEIGNDLRPGAGWSERGDAVLQRLLSTRARKLQNT